MKKSIVRRICLLVAAMLAIGACSSGPAQPTEESTLPVEQVEQGVEEVADATEFQLRPFRPMHDGEPIIAGISYGPYREGQKPGGPDPTAEQMREDLQIIAQHWHMLRVYGSRGPTADMLRVIRDDNLPIQVVLGAWIGPDDPEANAAEVDTAIRLANEFPDQVAAVSVGNESQVFWSGHKTPIDVLMKHLRKVRRSVAQPVTTGDDYNFWNKPESQPVAAEVDFILLHAYAMWNQQQLDEAVQWTADVVASIEEHHPDRTIVIGETGWATRLNPDGNEAEHIKAPAGEAEQTAFYREFTQWAASEGQPYFYFEAFDEPWKGSDDPREVEKHWGLYNVDRTPKPAIAEPGETKDVPEKQ